MLNNKAKIGKNIYFASIIISMVVLLLSMFLLPTKSLEGDALSKRLVYRYIIVFICLVFLIPAGCIIREYCYGKYIKKMLIIKIIITSLVLVSGLLIIGLTMNPAYSKVIALLGALVLIYTAAPTVKDNEKNV